MAASRLDSCSSAFAERAGRTSRYIQELMAIERIVLHGGPKTGAAWLLHEQLVKRYPVEYSAISRELRKGELTRDAQFKLLSEAQNLVWSRQDELDRQQEEQKQNRNERKEARPGAGTVAQPGWPGVECSFLDSGNWPFCPWHEAQ